MSANIVGHFEKIIRFTCENKSWPYKRSRLEVLVATLVAGHLGTSPIRQNTEPGRQDTDIPEEQDNSYFPSFLATVSSEPEPQTGLGIDLTSLSPDRATNSFPYRQKSHTSPILPSSSRISPDRGRSFSITSSPRNITNSPESTYSDRPILTSSPSIPRHRNTLNSTEKFPYEKALFQFRIWVFCMLVAGSVSPETADTVETCLGAISQLSFLCPSQHGHLPTRADITAASSAAKSTPKMFHGDIESATGVGDFASGQFSEFDVRWSKTQGTQKMFRTRRGWYGMGPVSLEKGDQVWVVCDSRVPLVLRPSKITEGAFELVGETYLHGCMHGEMMTPDQLDSIGPVSLV